MDGQLEQGFLYAGDLSPVAELDGRGDLVSRFIYGTKANVPRLLGQGRRKLLHRERALSSG